MYVKEKIAREILFKFRACLRGTLHRFFARENVRVFSRTGKKRHVTLLLVLVNYYSRVSAAAYTIGPMLQSSIFVRASPCNCSRKRYSYHESLLDNLHIYTLHHTHVVFIVWTIIKKLYTARANA